MDCLSSFFPLPVCSLRYSWGDAGAGQLVKNSRALEALSLKHKEGLSAEEDETVCRIWGVREVNWV